MFELVNAEARFCDTGNENMTTEKMIVKGIDIRCIRINNEDYFSLSDIARFKNPTEPKVVVANWMRLRNTVEYLGVWEYLNNPGFNGLEFEAFLREAGANAFTLSPKLWKEKT